MRVLLALLLPSTLLTVLCVGGAGLLMVGWRSPPARRAGRILLGTGVAGFVCVLVLPVDFWLLRPLEDRLPWRIRFQVKRGYS
jgi:hypothetical protein